jgi:hypothetical protein
LELAHIAYNITDGINDEDKRHCLNIIKERYGNSQENRYYDKINILKKNFSQWADFVLLLNVFHEISPDIWEKTLKNEILPLLSQTGKLLICEVDELTHGEKASNCSFLVLTKEAIQKLFSDSLIVTNSRKISHNRQISVHVIQAPTIKNVEKKTIKEALNSINCESLRNIRNIRSEAMIHNDEMFFCGLKHAFWLHRFANATLALENLQ